ncbi:TetR family transcriptional regulator [Acrocarpospora pleiomorpha]|uniref:TetR family transcriptional regulator n=1 Tax=Acrocarpospora pleiomorpha TaxID=90975 RepID=A0A5M3X911_9ACTN|nr:TetR/AcrR family transcriptional regulator [Acrocarpospora pleiomorpha]GES17584.1 TetR family transcriptional regulator [Acrocarpospora pleiomorpha]
MEPSAAQQRLLDAAVDAFAESGFGGTSTRDIATRAGRSPAAVYIHHESKEELLFAVSIQGHIDSMECLRQAAASSNDPAERLHGMVYAYSRWHMVNAKLGRVVQYEFHALTAEHRQEILALRRQFQKVMVEAVLDGVHAGRFSVDDAAGTARALLSLCIDLARWFEPGPGRKVGVVADLNADLALRIVNARPSGAPRAAQNRNPVKRPAKASSRRGGAAAKATVQREGTSK